MSTEKADKAWLLASQLIAQGLEDVNVSEITYALRVVAMIEAISDNAEQRYTKHGVTTCSVPSKHPGYVALVWAGRDCDGVQYSGQVQYVKATLEDVTKAIDHELEWADGPCNYVIAKPSEVVDVKYESRDLTMEAHENGHPHVLYT